MAVGGETPGWAVYLEGPQENESQDFNPYRDRSGGKQNGRLLIAWNITSF